MLHLHNAFSLLFLRLLILIAGTYHLKDFVSPNFSELEQDTIIESATWPSNSVCLFPAQKYTTRSAMKMHNGFEKYSIHQNVVCSRLPLGHVLS
jgi:hypothetical protein